MNTATYQIKLPQFEGPFDLLLFFIERDEIDIYNIPINNIIKDFLLFIHEKQKINIELGSEFILFISTLMRIKAKMLIPRKELDPQGNEIDPRQELVDKILEYKRFKDVSLQMAEMEAQRMLSAKRGNLQQELADIGEQDAEGTEIQTITLFKLTKAFEKAIRRQRERNNKPIHTVLRYNYTMQGSRDQILTLLRHQKTLPFQAIFHTCEGRLHAIFLFLSLLELVQLRHINILTGTGRNNFIIESNSNRLEEIIPQTFLAAN